MAPILPIDTKPPGVQPLISMVHIAMQYAIFLRNACMWLREYHFDALRLDALHSIFDYSAYHFLAELSDHVHRLAHQSNRHIYLIAESALNDAKLIRTDQNGGYAIDSQWNDDFHHALHALLTQEKYGYYLDFGGIEQMIKALREGYVLTGQYSQYWLCRHGGVPNQFRRKNLWFFHKIMTMLAIVY